MLISDNYLSRKQSYSNEHTVTENRTEQTNRSTPNHILEKQASKSNSNDIAVIFEKSSSNNFEMITYTKPNAVKATAVTKSTIKDVQTKLNSIGYSCGTPDGIAGKNTTSAVISFQKLCGLTNQSGTITNETIAKLNLVCNRNQNGVLSRGLKTTPTLKNYKKI